MTQSSCEQHLATPPAGRRPALDATIGDCPDHDQRGVPRPQDGNGDGVALCDLGAYALAPPN